MADFDQAIALDQSQALFFTDRGNVYDELQQFEEALADYIEAVSILEADGVDPEDYADLEARIAELEAEVGPAVVEAEPTAEEVEEATPAPAAEPTATEVVANITGHIAVPLLAGNEPRVYVVDTAGNQVNVLGSARQPTHTLDGSRLLVNGDGGSQVLLRMANSNGAGPTEFGNPNLSAHSHPAWSSDGSEVYYLDRFGTQEFHLFKRALTSTEGEGEEIVTAQGAIFHSNPLYPQVTTQDRIIFSGCSTWTGQGGECGVWVLQGQGGQASRISQNVNHIPTDAAGNTVVFSWNQAGNWDVYTLDIGSGAMTQLTDSPSQDALGTISPDGQSVAFYSNREGGPAVWVVSINGGPAEKLFDIPRDWGTLRGDGWTEETLSWGK